MLRQPVPAVPFAQRAVRAAQVERGQPAPRRPAAPRPSLFSSPAGRQTRRQGRCVLSVTAAYPDSMAGGEAASSVPLVARMSGDLLTALSAKVKEGDVFVEGTVAVATRGGLIVRFGEGGSGFVPAGQLDPSRLLPGDAGNRDPKWLTGLLEEKMELLILEVNMTEGKVFLSERAAIVRKAMADFALGDVRSGVVTRLTEYGAFVRMDKADGSGPAPGVEGLVHVSEISWSRLRYPSDGLKTGQKVKVKVIKLDTENRQVGLSIKQLLADPIMQTLDTVLPVDGSEAEGAEGSSDLPLPGLLELVQQMRSIPGIQEVSMGRQATEQRVVSQDLELWMTNQPLAEGFGIVARAGRQVQELRLKTDLSKEEVKAMLRTITMKK